MQIFARITKVDEASRTVEGVIADETPDKTGEIFDYEKSKPNFEKWSTDIAKATGGKNLGNVRVMHGNTVAGVTKELNFDDAAKAITVKAHIVDENEWNKTLAGCYTGFSIGGRYGKRWEAGDLKRYEAIPNEYSLVDLPCNPAAQFTVVKTDGAEELRKFDSPLAKRAQNLLTKIDQAEPLLRTVRAAFGKEPLQKTLWNVADLARTLIDLDWITVCAEDEAIWEDDNSPVPPKLRSVVKELAGILKEMAEEETTELISAYKAETPGDLRKVAITPEEDTMNAELQKAHDEAQASLKKAADDLAKANDSLAKVSAERDDLKKAVDERDGLLIKAAKHIEAQGELIEKMKDQPDALKIALSSFGKGEDIQQKNEEDKDKVLKADGTVDEAATAIRKALRNPVVTR